MSDDSRERIHGVGYEEAERFVVGALLAKAGRPEVYETLAILASVDGAEFHDPYFRKVFMAIRHVANLGGETTVGNVVTVLRDGPEFSDADIEAVAVLQSYAYRSLNNMCAAAKELRIRYLRNEIRRSAEGLVSDCGDGAVEFEDIKASVLKMLTTAHDESSGKGHARKAGEFAENALSTIRKRWDAHDRNEPASGITSGFPDYDLLVGGFYRKELVVVGGRPSIGKTMTLVHSSLGAAKAGTRTGVWSLEMPNAPISERFVSNLARLDARLVRIGNFVSHCGAGGRDMAAALREKYRQRLEAAYAELNSLPLYFYDHNSNVDDIIASMLVAKRKHNISLFYVDYIQRIGGSGEMKRTRSPRHEQVGDIAFRLKEFAKSEDVAVVAFAQINRTAMGNPDAKPELENLKDSGAIEQEADVVVLLHRRKDRDTGYYCDEMEMDVAKNRNGETRKLLVQVVPHESRFEIIHGEYQ